MNNVKLECIRLLEELIQNIKEDDRHYNYQYIEEVLEMETDYNGVIRRVRFGIERTERYYK